LLEEERRRGRDHRGRGAVTCTGGQWGCRSSSTASMERCRHFAFRARSNSRLSCYDASRGRRSGGRRAWSLHRRAINDTIIITRCDRDHRLARQRRRRRRRGAAAVRRETRRRQVSNATDAAAGVVEGSFSPSLLSSSLLFRSMRRIIIKLYDPRTADGQVSVVYWREAGGGVVDAVAVDLDGGVLGVECR